MMFGGELLSEVPLPKVEVERPDDGDDGVGSEGDLEVWAERSIVALMFLSVGPSEVTSVLHLPGCSRARQDSRTHNLDSIALLEKQTRET